MISNEEYPALTQFFGGYFHQDWDLEAAEWQGLVRNFCDAACHEQIAVVYSELGKLLAEAQDERDLSVVLFSQLGCAYDPTVDGISLRDWIEEIQRQLLASTAP